MSGQITNTDELGSSWGILCTYNTPEERDQTLDSFEDEFEHLRKHAGINNIQEFQLPRGTVNCVDLSGQSSLISGDDTADQEVTGWIKSRRVILLCKEWEWSLIQQRNGRWKSHLDRVVSVSDLPETPSEAVWELLDEEKISELPQRLVAHEYLEHRELFTRFLDTINADQTKLQSIVERKRLTSLDESERELLLHTNREIYRYLCANELSSRDEFNRPKFRNLFGEIPFQIGFGIDTAIFDDLVAKLSERRCECLGDFVAIETLSCLLSTEDAGERLKEDTISVLDQDAESLFEFLQRAENKDDLIKKGQYISQYIDQEDVYSVFNTLLATTSLVRLKNDEQSPLQLMDLYHSPNLDPEDKAHVSRLLVHMMDQEMWDAHSNYEKVAEFLSGEGAKLVLLLDGLPLTQDSSVEFLEEKTSDERWDVGFGVAPPLSITEVFREGLYSAYNFGRLGGFTDDGKNLSQIELDAFFGEKEDELVDLLNNDESVIVYDSAIDRSGRYPTDVEVKVRDYWMQKINEFINRFGTYADILIVADHGLVQTHESRAIPTPSNGEKKGIRHCRACFVDERIGSDQAESLNVSQIPVQIPDSGERCVMLNPNIPNAKFGTQQDDIWTHGGISIEESIVPFVERRRST